MQLNTDHKKACLLKDFFLDIFQNVGFVCFRMCWRILMTLLLHDQNSSKLQIKILVFSFLTVWEGWT